MNPDVLHFADGHVVEFVRQETDPDGEVLVIEHRWPTAGRLAGPHWHPVLRERFEVRSGAVRFRIDGRETVARAGDVVGVDPPAVHEFWSEEPNLVLRHEVRPPMNHRRMFEFWHELDRRGATTRAGVPKNPLDLALLWKLQDGYLAGIPAVVQRAVLGTLARVALSRRSGSVLPRRRRTGSGPLR